MTPDFALSLSQDGIDLLRLTEAGWKVVAQADPREPDLGAQMHALRKKTDAPDGEPLDVSIILPEDQVKFFSLETSGLDTAARTALVRDTLDETTPYTADEIVFDAQVDGNTTNVAAVARQTLDEAEAFARQFDFAPMSYVAQPQDGPAFAIDPQRDGLKTPSETAAVMSALKDAAAQSVALAPPGAQAESLDKGTFVSRRRVPTFRTKLSAFSSKVAERGAGFAESASSFKGARTTSAPKKERQKPSHAPGKERAFKKEKERMTIFGMRTSDSLNRGIGPVGIGIAAASVVALGIFAFANSALGTNLASFLALLNAPKPTAQFTAPLQPQIAGESTVSEPGKEVELASLDDTLTDEDQPCWTHCGHQHSTHQHRGQIARQMRCAQLMLLREIWPLAPDIPTPPPLIDLDNLYQTSVDPIDMNFDAVALPALRTYEGDEALLALASPAPAGTTFELDEKGFVIPTPQGALNPDGVQIFSGPPPIRQPATLVKLEEPGQDMEIRLRLVGFRPQARPADLIETSERAVLGGLTRSELGQLRPRLRPDSPQDAAVAAAITAASLVPTDSGTAQPLVPNEEDLLATATARAVPVSLRPDARPLNFAAVIERAASPTAAPAATQVAAASTAPRLVTPTIPSATSVAREATISNALNLRKVNLIGVYGQPSSRRALVRLSNGRYVKVEVGDRIDGGRVSAIGDAELRYQKSGRDIILKMPRS